jgi:hypothetical protein
MEPMPPNTAATKHLRPGSEPASGYTEERGMKYSMEPSAARPLPMTKVKLMTALMRTPMSWLVSKSLDTARMAMPILVFLMRATSSRTSTTVSTGVMKVTSVVEMFPSVTLWLRKPILS